MENVMALSLSFTKIHVQDAASAEHFYAAALGLKTVARIEEPEGEHAMLEVIMTVPTRSAPAANLILVSYPNRPVPAPGEAVTGFMVADLEAALERSVAAGATIETPVTEVPEHGLRLAFILDPQGHRVELLERTAA
jgi:predicted enzyme related to lactoylglutathione lyase